MAVAGPVNLIAAIFCTIVEGRPGIAAMAIVLAIVAVMPPNLALPAMLSITTVFAIPAFGPALIMSTPDVTTMMGDLTVSRCGAVSWRIQVVVSQIGTACFCAIWIEVDRFADTIVDLLVDRMSIPVATASAVTRLGA
ncbi:MAG: hypothetical protein ACR2PF_09085 [Rhizobiaceae bacterium]